MSSTRREFLSTFAGISGVLSLGPALPAFLRRLRAEEPRPGERGRVLVLVQLTGGNDGLNSVVPFEDDEYARARPTLRLLPRDVLKIGPALGFHPAMEAFARLHDEGVLGILQGVGYPASSRDHEIALRDWQTAAPGEADAGVRSGWAGRAADLASPPGDPWVPAAFVGPIERPLSLVAPRSVLPSIESGPDLLGGARPGGLVLPIPDPGPRREGSPEPPIDSTRRAAILARDLRRRIEALGVPDDGGYPPFGLARDLRAIASLIRADLGIRIYLAELGGGGLGGFDTHAGQAGNHAALVRQLSLSVAAFADDLRRDRLLDEVLLLTYSEFGRTVAENGRRGTDHGAAAPAFLVGGRVRGGVAGETPSLTETDGGGLAFGTDFRRLYATALGSWLGLDSGAILGGRFEPLDILRGVSGRG